MEKSCRKKRSHALDAPQGPLVDYLGPFERLLADQGYPHDSARRHLRLIADFSVWLKAKKMSVENVTQESAQYYLRYRWRHRCRRKGNTYALRRFVQLLQQNGVVKTDTSVAQTPVERLVSEYSSYLHQERGLAPTTVRRYARLAQLFLTKELGTNASSLSGLGAQQVIRFVRSEVADTYSGPQAQKMATGLRSFLQYARYRGYIKLDLAAAVPRVAGWSMTSIPKAIAPEEARRVLASCDRRRAVGRRDYAMLLLLARLGLRAGEVASLTLDDIDWDAG